MLMNYQELRLKLADLEAVLRNNNENYFAEMISSVLHSPSVEGLEKLIISNDLWGGAGSVADQAGVGDRDAGRRSIEAALIALGELQTKHDLFNVRTRSWVDAFKKWRDMQL
jgi:hypothetical protein